MEFFSKVISWIAFAVLVIVTLVFIESYPRGDFRSNPSAVQIIQIWVEYLGVVIPVYCLARLIQLGCAPTVRDRMLIKDKHKRLIEEGTPATASEIEARLRKETELKKHGDLAEAVRERNKQAYEDAMREQGDK